MESFGIRPDIGFYNQMIKQRAFRGDHKQGLDTLNELSEQAGLYILVGETLDQLWGFWIQHDVSAG